MLLHWNQDSVDILKGCFSSTEGSIFHNQELHDETVIIMDFLKFCASSSMDNKTLWDSTKHNEHEL